MDFKRTNLLEDTLLLPLGVHLFVFIIVGIDVYYLTGSKNNDITFLWIRINDEVLVVSFKIRYGFALCLLKGM
jgi:hypothetical protein